MKRLLIISLVMMLLVALAPPAYADSPLQEGDGGETDGIGNVIGTLGLYAAIMAVLAIGSEVVIDAIRPIFGLKRKKTASEALSEMKDWLPGTLKDVGASPEAQQRLNERIGEMEALTAQFDDRAEEIRRVTREEMPDILKNLAIHSVDEALDQGWEKLEPRLRLVDPDADLEKIKGWLEDTLTYLEETNVAEVTTHLDSISTLLDAVREQNNKLQGPLRKLWRWLRTSLLKVGHTAQANENLPQALQAVIAFLCRVPSYPEYFLAWLKGNLPSGDTLGERLENISEHKRFTPVLTMEEAAKRILEEDVGYKDQEKSRIAWLRILCTVIGIALAAALQVDSLKLLEPVLGNAATTFRPAHEPGQIVEWYTFEDFIEQRVGDVNPRLGLPGVLGMTAAALLRLTPGITLSGLGAAAGSNFWHDKLDKLRHTKHAIAQVQEMME